MPTDFLNTPLHSQMVSLIRVCGLSQGEIGRRMGVTAGAISKYISADSTPSIANLTALAEACGARVALVRGGAAKVEAAASALSEPQQDALLRLAAAMPFLEGEDVEYMVSVAERAAARRRAQAAAA